MPEKSKYNWDKIWKIVTAVMAFCGLTLGTVAYVVADHYATTYLVKKIEDDRDKFHLAIQDMIDNSVKGVATQVSSDMLNQMSSMAGIYTSMKGFKGMTDKKMVSYVQDKFHFADTIQTMMPIIMENHEWVSQQRDGHTASEYITCGTILAKDGEPKYFKDCDGTKRKIYYGRPSGVNINSGKKVYYYRNDNDKHIILSSISNY